MNNYIRIQAVQPIILVLLLWAGVPLRSYGQATGGIGAVLLLDTTKDGYTMPRIKSLVPGGPAAAQSIPEGLYIISVNNTDCKNKPLEDVVGVIRGAAGTPVNLALADNAQGKKAKTYTIVRAIMQAQATNMPQPDPVTIFNVSCDNEVKQLKKQGFAIIKTFTSDCGDYFFNFDTENAPYHVRVITMEAKPEGDYTKGFEATATLFDNSDEATKTPLKSTAAHEQGNTMIAELEGVMTMKRNSTGVVQVELHTLADVKRCAAMYVIVYK